MHTPPHVPRYYLILVAWSSLRGVVGRSGAANVFPVVKELGSNSRKHVGIFTKKRPVYVMTPIDLASDWSRLGVCGFYLGSLLIPCRSGLRLIPPWSPSNR